jgi:hypothetical protein
MKAITKRPCSVIDRLSHIRMTDRERQVAMAYLRQGEIVADVMIQATVGIRSVVQFIARGFHALARVKQ